MDSLRAASDSFKQELVKEAGSQGQQFISDIDDWTDMGVTRISLFLSYYNLAARVQNDAGALKALQSRTSIVQDRLKDNKKKEAAVVTAALLVHERQQKQVQQWLHTILPHHHLMMPSLYAGDARHQVSLRGV